MRRFEESMNTAGIGEDARDRFYRRNFEDLLGSAVTSGEARSSGSS